jgi:Domain of unknown function (DUF4166)
MPAAGDDVDMRLRVTPLENGVEQWHRFFDGRLMQSAMRQVQPEIVAERVGRMEITFQLQAVGGALHYRQIGSAFCLGPCRVPIPRWLSVNVAAWEKATGDRISVTVEARAPIIGLFISYRGSVTVTEERT